MTEEKYGQFQHEAYECLMAQQDILISEYGMTRYEHWDYDQVTGEFVFSDAGVPKLIAHFQVVGSISTISNTWLWSWANPHIEENVKKDLHAVKQFGEEHGLRELTEEKWAAGEVEGWGMTNIVAMLLKAKGAYRCPGDNGPLFVIFTDVWRPPV